MEAAGTVHLPPGGTVRLRVFRQCSLFWQILISVPVDYRDEMQLRDIIYKPMDYREEMQLGDIKTEFLKSNRLH